MIFRSIFGYNKINYLLIETKTIKITPLQMIKKNIHSDKTNTYILHILFWFSVIVLYYIDYEPIKVYRSDGIESFLLQKKAWAMALWNSLTCFPFAYLNFKLISLLEQTNYAKSKEVKFKIAYFIVIVPIVACVSSSCFYFLLMGLKDYFGIFEGIFKIQLESTMQPNEVWYRNFPETVFIMVGLISITQNRSLHKEKTELEADKNQLETDKNQLETDKHQLEADKNQLENQKDFLEAEKDFLEAQKNLLEIQINLLRKRMEPHFIIGVLNGIFLEVNKKMPHAGEQIDLLSSQLRYIMKESEQVEVLLSDEVAFVRNYIKLKMLEQTNKDVEIEDRMILTDFEEDRRIIPLVLVEFVENAFKYSFKVRKRRYIKLYLYADEEDSICIRIENKRITEIDKLDVHSTKEGLKNLRARLELTYPNAHTFLIEDTDPNKYAIFLKINSNKS